MEQTLQPPPRKPVADNSIKRVFNPDGQMLGEYFTPASDVYFKGIYTLLPPKQRAPENNSGECFKRDQYVYSIIRIQYPAQYSSKISKSWDSLIY